jgi:ribA/ribD-fused uncharacterized protein
MQNTIIKGFSGKYRFLSNFYPCEIEHLGLIFPTVEHAYQASKARDLVSILKVKNAATPAAAKRTGQKIKIRSDWNDVKIPVMTFLVKQKFSREPLATMLTDTYPCAIIEFNTWGDTFWGMIEKDDILIGNNHLGKILMEIRNERRST